MEDSNATSFSQIIDRLEEEENQSLLDFQNVNNTITFNGVYYFSQREFFIPLKKEPLVDLSQSQLQALLKQVATKLHLMTDEDHYEIILGIGTNKMIYQRSLSALDSYQSYDKVKFKSQITEQKITLEGFTGKITQIGGIHEDQEEFAIYTINYEKQITFKTIIRVQDISLKFQQPNYNYARNNQQNKQWIQFGLMKMIQFMQRQNIRKGFVSLRFPNQLVAFFTPFVIDNYVKVDNLTDKYKKIKDRQKLNIQINGFDGQIDFIFQNTHVQTIFEIEIKSVDFDLKEKIIQLKEELIHCQKDGTKDLPLSNYDLSLQKLIKFKRIYEFDENVKTKCQIMSDLQLLKEVDQFEAFRQALEQTNIEQYIDKYGNSPLIHFIEDNESIYEKYVTDLYASEQQEYWNNRIKLTQQDLMDLLIHQNISNEKKEKIFNAIFKVSFANDLRVSVVPYDEDHNHMLQSNESYLQDLFDLPIYINGYLQNNKHIIWNNPTSKQELQYDALNYKDLNPYHMTKRPIQYLTSAFKVNLYLSSYDNNLFFSKVLKFLPHELYSSDIIKIIDFHWFYNSFYITLYNINYFVYSILVVIHLQFRGINRNWNNNQQQNQNNDNNHNDYNNQNRFGGFEYGLQNDVNSQQQPQQNNELQTKRILLIFIMVYAFFLMVLEILQIANNLSQYRNRMIQNGINPDQSDSQQILRFKMKQLMTYLTDLYNIMDIVASVGFLIYGSMTILEYDYPWIEWLHFTVILCATTRGLFSLLKCNDNTRYLTRMIIDVIKSVTQFLFIKFSVMFILAILLFKIEQIEPSEGKSMKSVFDAYFISLNLIMGTAEYKFNTPTKKAFQLTSYVIIQIIMAKIVISVIADIFSQIQQDKKVQDTVQKIKILLEYSNNQFYQKNKNNYKYIHVIRYLDKEEVKGLNSFQDILMQNRLQNQIKNQINRQITQILKVKSSVQN